MQNFKPLNKNVYAQLINNEAKTDSGIFLGNIKSDIETAIVVASASDLIKQKEKIMFHKFSGLKVKEGFVVIKESDILGTLEPFV